MSTWQLPPPCTLVCSFCLQIFWELVIHFAVQWWEQMELKRFKPCLVIQLLCWFPRSCTEAFMREKYTSAIIWWPAATQNFPTKSLRKMPKYRCRYVGFRIMPYPLLRMARAKELCPWQCTYKKVYFPLKPLWPQTYWPCLWVELCYHHNLLNILLFVITLLTIYYLRLIYKLTYQYLIILFSIKYFKTV